MVGRLLYRRVPTSLVWLALCALPVLVGCRAEPPLPELGPAPSFQLLDQDGTSFGSSDLGPRLAVASFIYTSCTDSCPLLTAQMARLRDQLRPSGLLGSQVMLLSFTIDPERDSPEVLRRYGEKFGADSREWRLLTGPVEQLGQLAQDFKLGRPIPLPLDARNPVVNLAHSNRVVLVDGHQQIRATYLAESVEPDEIVRDLQRLSRQGN